jgi:hypothetical protein
MSDMNKNESVRKWVSEFNQVPQMLIKKAYPCLDEVEILVTEKECTECGGNPTEENTCEQCDGNDFVERYGLPMWGTMWTFCDSSDERWAENNLEKMRECGFFVYQSDELGLFFGIDGAGYDFFADHWGPLYDARGLRWHKSAV